MCSGEIMMHLTCTNLPKEQVYQALEKAKQLGIRNILALRGDPPKGSEAWEACENGFANAQELVAYIRRQYGDYFGVAVAGYPEGHVSAKSIDDDIAFLKTKCDAGADFVITQLFYDVDLFIGWVKKCRAAGISVPIIPGIMPIQNYTGFKRMTQYAIAHTAPPAAVRRHSGVTRCAHLCVPSVLCASVGSARRPSLSTSPTRWSPSRTTTPGYTHHHHTHTSSHMHPSARTRTSAASSSPRHNASEWLAQHQAPPIAEVNAETGENVRRIQGRPLWSDVGVLALLCTRLHAGEAAR
jgi:hypothetical protein